MRRVITIVVALIGVYIVARRSYVAPVATRTPIVAAPAVPAPAVAAPVAPATDVEGNAGNAAIARAFASHARDVRVDGAGTVSRLLSDDTQGDRHQRFLVRLPSGQTVLITHNIDVAPRVANLRVGAAIEFEGEYVWNAQGGLVHWTHHDPSARHKAGWIRYGGRTYQ